MPFSICKDSDDCRTLNENGNLTTGDIYSTCIQLTQYVYVTTDQITIVTLNEHHFLY